MKIFRQSRSQKPAYALLSRLSITSDPETFMFTEFRVLGSSQGELERCISFCSSRTSQNSLKTASHAFDKDLSQLRTLGLPIPL